MRINKLKFSNLNSLKGIFEIDFTDNSIIEDNIFAIIGNTGSGKSTILDAITLALFAKTARIEKITGSSNEIMNRDSGSCYSEVIFTTSNKEYSALFSQRKARSKKDGNFIMYTRELRNYSDNKLIASNKTFDVELMNLINLTFDQFSRSVLLAQGDFNKFLIAKDDDKAKILEQITGTEIYSRIGMKIFEHYSFEKKKLEILDAQLGSQNILTDEEKKNIERDIAENYNKIIELNSLKKSNNENLLYYSIKSNLDKKRSDLSYDINIMHEDTPTYKKYLSKIELNQKAKQPLELLEKIKTDTNSKEILFNDITVLEKEIILINENIKLLSKEETNKRAELELNQLEKIKTTEIIKMVRPLDKAINELSIKKDNLFDKIGELKYALEALNKDSSLVDLQIDDSNSSINNSNDYLSAHIADKLLVDNFTEIVSNNNLLKTTTTQKITLENDIKTTNISLADESQLEMDLIKKLDDTNNSIAEIKSSYSLDKNKDELDKRFEFLNNRKSILERTSLILENYLEDTKILAVKTTEYNKTTTQYNNMKKELDETSLLYDASSIALERGKELLKLSAFASEVKTDVPCPLCGSLEHPHPIFVEENQLKNEESNVNKLKYSLDICNTEVISLNSKIHVIKARITQLENSIIKNSSTLSKVLGQDEYFKSAFDKSKTLNNKSIIDVKSQLKALEDIEKQISTLLTDNATYNESLKNNTKNILNLKKTIEDIKKKHSIADDKLKSIDTFFKNLSTFKNRSNKELETIKSQFTNHQNIVENKSIELDNLKSNKIKILSNIDIKKVTIKETEANTSDITTKLNKFINDRILIFGKKDCDDELNSIDNLIKKKETQLLSFTTQLIEKDKLRSNKLTELKINQEIYKTIKSSLIDNKERFEVLLTNNKFSNINDLISAKLNVDDITNYELFIKEYENLCERIKAIEDDIKKDENSLNKSKPQKGYDDCLKDKSEFDNDYDLLQQSKGNLQEKIDLDKKNVSRIGKIKKDREKQYIKNDNWAKLNAAVGSSDGKKFRGLAQGITLDFLLNNSNHKLTNLTDRYSLVRSNSSNGSTLDIDVIDFYMNGITRSVANLSGGEKFLVSLSLALGLCELVNSDNPSETLFLDEGFGSLDEDTLDNALNTLMILSESENKLIGIISHVQKVKDAINHKIIVEKNGNGSSSITGPGVKQL